MARIKSYDRMVEFYQTVVHLHVPLFQTPSLVARSHIQHSDNRAALGIVFSEEVLSAASATVVVVFGEGAFQVGSDESVRSRFAGNSPRGAGEGLLAADGAARLHDSSRQLPDPPRFVICYHSTPGLYEGGYNDECCRLFSSLLPLDNTYHIFGDTQGIQCALLAASQLSRWKNVLEAYSVLTSLHAVLPSSLLLVVCKVGIDGGYHCRRTRRAICGRETMKRGWNR